MYDILVIISVIYTQVTNTEEEKLRPIHFFLPFCVGSVAVTVATVVLVVEILSKATRNQKI